jgi:hypothetical protein
MRKRTFSSTLWVLMALEVVHFLVRWALIRSPFFSEVDYDQAIPGLMALHILRGEPQLVLWGQPRMGGLEAYLAAFIFYLGGPSTLSLHFSFLVVSAATLLAVYGLGYKVGGVGLGLLAAAYWAVPPIFLTFTGSYAGGGHQEAVLLGSFLLFAASLLPSRPPLQQRVLALLMGLLAGAGVWSSLLILPFIVASAFFIIGTRPGLFWSPLLWLAPMGGLLGSLPFWTWNYFHDFNTFLHLGGKGFGSFFRHLWIVLWVGFQTLMGTFWDAQSVFQRIPRTVQWVIGWGIYAPVGILSSAVFLLWLKRLFTKHLPFKNVLDLVILLFWLFILFRATGEAEDIGLTRYHLVWFVPVAVLTGWWLNRLWKVCAIVGWAALILVLGFNLFTQFLYLQQHGHEPVRPVDALIRALQKEGIRYCYGHNRVTQVVTFESRERIIAADFFGTRNYDYLRAVDEAPLSETAFLTHRTLGNPYPAALKASLKRLNLVFKEREVGDYVFFYAFKPPVGPCRSVPAAEWKVEKPGEETLIFSLNDRDLLTSYRIDGQGQGLRIDLGCERRVVGISFLPFPGDVELPSRFRVESSGGGKVWKTLAEVDDYLPGLVWAQGRPRLETLPTIQLFFPPENARYLKVIPLEIQEGGRAGWRVAELFVYEAQENPPLIPAKAQYHLTLAQTLLDRWMDDPTGPHPSIPRLSMEFRKKKVDWPKVVRNLESAIEEAPDWEEPQHLFGRAVLWGDLGAVSTSLVGISGHSRKGSFSEEGRSFFSPKSWKATAWPNGGEASLAVDGDPATRWTSGKGQEPGMFFQVDLGSPQRMEGVSIFLGGALYDYPRGLQIQVSSDGKAWREVKTRVRSAYAFVQGRLLKKVDYRFAEEEGRLLRLVQTGTDPQCWWSIYELDLIGPGHRAAVEKKAGS